MFGCDVISVFILIDRNVVGMGILLAGMLGFTSVFPVLNIHSPSPETE